MCPPILEPELDILIGTLDLIKGQGKELSLQASRFINIRQLEFTGKLQISLHYSKFQQEAQFVGACHLQTTIHSMPAAPALNPCRAILPF